MANCNTNKNHSYVLLYLYHKSFSSAKTVLVKVPSISSTLISDYVKMAKEKACKHFGDIGDEISVSDYLFIGRDILFVD